METIYSGMCTIHYFPDPTCSSCTELENSAAWADSYLFWGEESYACSGQIPSDNPLMELELGETWQYDNGSGACDLPNSTYPDPTVAQNAPSAFPSSEQVQPHPADSNPLAHTMLKPIIPWAGLQYENILSADVSDPVVTTKSKQKCELQRQGQDHQNRLLGPEKMSVQEEAPVMIVWSLHNGTGNKETLASLPSSVASSTRKRCRPSKLDEPKKKQKTNKPRNSTPKLTEPLSTMTKNLAGSDWQFGATDIELYVKRSTETRRHEHEGTRQKGKICRPQNSFLLYRKAYQKRAKEWCDQECGMAASIITAQSWAIETEEVKLQFKEWADIERSHHKIAFPGYKYDPRPEKHASSPAKRKNGREKCSRK